jgi:hypothetical protein
MSSKEENNTEVEPVAEDNRDPVHKFTMIVLAFVALLVLFNGSLGDDANFTANFIARVTFISLAVLYVVSALRVVDRYWPQKRAV